MQLPIASVPVLSRQFIAILGDLQHKQDVYLSRQNFDVATTCLFANCEQAGWLLDNRRSLIPPGYNYNNHSLGTFFEFYYYSDAAFRFQYFADLPSLTCRC